MIKSMKRVQRKWRQRGAILAFTALLFPMIIVGVGLAVDLGNIYVQHARLQNAADAAEDAAEDIKDAAEDAVDAVKDAADEIKD